MKEGNECRGWMALKGKCGLNKLEWVNGHRLYQFSILKDFNQLKFNSRIINTVICIRVNLNRWIY